MSVCVCLFSIKIQTAGQIGTKLARRCASRGDGSWGVSAWYPHPPHTGCIKGVRGASGASTVHFGENFIKQKLQGTPDLVRVGHLFGSQIRISFEIICIWQCLFFFLRRREIFIRLVRSKTQGPM